MNANKKQRRLLDFKTLTGISSSIPAVGLALPVGAGLAALAIIDTTRASIPKWIKRAVAAAILGMLAYFGTWVYRGGEFPGSGIGQFGVSAVLMLGYSRLAASTSQAASLVSSVALGNIAYFALFPTENTSGSIFLLWKYGIAFPAAVLLIFLLCRRTRFRLGIILALATIGVASAFLDTRSVSLVCFAAAAIVAVKAQPDRKQAFRTAIAGSLVLTALFIFLPKALEAGYLGEAAQLRTTTQTEETSNPLLGGRKEPPLSIAAIRERPVFGWGNAQNLDSETIANGSDLAQRLGMGSSDNYLPVWIREEGRISLHSVALNAWVDAGLLAAVFPFTMIALSGVALLKTRGQWAPLVVLTSAATVWSMLFSPWGGSQVVLMSAWAVLAARATEESSRNVSVAEGTDLGGPAASSRGHVSRHQ